MGSPVLPSISQSMELSMNRNGDTLTDVCLNSTSETCKIYDFSICAIFKDESKYLKEWIEYHRLFGVDHFYLYNIGSKDCFQSVLHPYIEEGIVTLIHWPEAISNQDERHADSWALSTQIPAYENAVNFIAKNETKWLILVDIDEFLVCPKGNIRNLLLEYDDYSGIFISSVYFDADDQPKKKLLIQSLDLTSPPKQIITKSVAKTIFKPDQCTGFIWPPYQCRFATPDSCITLGRQELRINCYVNRNKGRTLFEKRKPKLNVDNRSLPDTMTAAFLAEGYLIEDQDRPIYKFIPELLNRLGQK